jgi:hypothetical protein
MAPRSIPYLDVHGRGIPYSGKSAIPGATYDQVPGNVSKKILDKQERQWLTSALTCFQSTDETTACRKKLGCLTPSI